MPTKIIFGNRPRFLGLTVVGRALVTVLSAGNQHFRLNEHKEYAMNTVTFKVEGMHCDGCATIIQSLLERHAGTQKAIASFKNGEARILYDPRAVTEEQLVAVIEKSGYRVAGRRHD